jgi:hypothetical protein
MEEGIDMITDTSNRGARIRNGLGGAIRANQVPLALIGLGTAWLLANNTGLAERVAQDERFQAARRRIGEVAGNLLNGGDAATESDAGQGGQVVGLSGEPHGVDRTDGWVHQAAGAARGAISSVRDAGAAVLDRASKYTDYAGDAGGRAKRVGGELVQNLKQDPWLIGVAGMVAGAALAALLPPSKLEQKYSGEARDELWNKAVELSHEAARCVRDLAASTARASKHSAPEC